MPGFGVPAGLPGLPSPATGVPATTDFLTGLIQAGPQFVQGEQQGEQIKEARRKRAQEDLQRLAPYAVQDPHNPATIKSIQKAFKALGLDPKAALNQDGSINSSALMQYNPYFSLFQTLASNPNANPSMLKWAAGQLGLNLPDLGQYTPKELDQMVQTFQKNATLVGSGHYSREQLMQDAQRLQIPLEQIGRGAEAQSLLQQAQNAGPGQLTQAQIGSTEALGRQRAQQTKYLAAQTADAEARNGLIRAQTVAQLHRVSLIDAQTYATYQRVNLEAQRVQTEKQRADTESQRVSSQNLSTALRAVTDYNNSVNNIQKEIDGLTGHLTALQNQNQVYQQAVDPQTGQKIPGQQQLTPTAAVIEGQLNQLRQLQQRYKTINPQDVTNRALHSAGLPSTQTILPNPQTNSDLRGQSYTAAQVKEFAKEAGMSYQDAIKQLRKRHATIKP